MQVEGVRALFAPTRDTPCAVEEEVGQECDVKQSDGGERPEHRVALDEEREDRSTWTDNEHPQSEEAISKDFVKRRI